MPLLEAVVGQNGRWCATVASECARGAVVPGLEGMGEAGAIFGSPLYPDAAEHVNVLLLQEQMMQPGDGATAHLGEAETITLINSRRLHAAFVTDDREAMRQAKLHDIPSYTTWHVLKLAVGTNLLDDADFFVAYDSLVSEMRGHPPCSRSKASVAAWLVGE